MANPARKSLDPRYQVIAPHLKSWWLSFNHRWKGCKLCPLHQHRNRIVHFRGIIPARICFIGEAPGESEDDLGRPFVGEAGRLLDKMLTICELEDGDFCIVNSVGCVPKRDVMIDGLPEPERRITAPTKEEVKTCSPRVTELVEYINPKMIVLLGRVAIQTVSSLPDVDLVYLTHPSAILRNGSKPSDIKRFTLTLTQALSNLQ